MSADTLAALLPVAVAVLLAAILAAGWAAWRWWQQSIRATEELRRTKALLARAETDLHATGTRLSQLLALHDDPVCCFQVDPPVSVNLPLAEQIRRVYQAKVFVCNAAFARLVGESDPEALAGRSVSELPGTLDTVEQDKQMATFIRRGYQLDDYRRLFNTADGPVESRVHLRGLIDNGLLRYAWGRYAPPPQNRESGLPASQRDTAQDVLARIATRLMSVSADRSEDAVKASLREYCRYCDADRATVFWRSHDGHTVDAIYSWAESGKAPEATLTRSEFAWITSLIDSGETVDLRSVDDLPPGALADRRSLERLGITSTLVAPMIVDGDIVGSLALTNISRQPNRPERPDHSVQVVAAVIGSAIVRDRHRRELDSALAELARAKDRLEAENTYLQQEILSSHGFNDIIGDSDSLKKALTLVTRVAESATPVLIQGETGTGKELFARAIHQRSGRRDRPLVKVNCAALPANLIESELFGHEKGAFTGAAKRKRGRFDLADGGTLFLDEIGEIPAPLQSKLLRVLQDGEFQRVGGTRTIRADVRLIAATNRNLLQSVEAGTFRADLLYRINTVTIDVPPLRDRRGDIALLARHFVHKYAQQLGRQVDSIASTSLENLEAHDWPGNVRELEGVIQRSLITTNGPKLEIDASLLQGRHPGSGVAAPGRSDPRPDTAASAHAEPRPMDLRSAEIEHIERVLNQCRWKIAGADGAASQLGLPESTLRSRMKKYGIHRPPSPLRH